MVGLDRWKEMRLRQSKWFQQPKRESISRIGIKIIDNEKSKQANRKKKEQLEWGEKDGGKRTIHKEANTKDMQLNVRHKGPEDACI